MFAQPAPQSSRQCVFHNEFRRFCAVLRLFLGIAAAGEMHVQIDKPRHQIISVKIYDFAAIGGRGQILFYRRYFSVFDDHRHIRLRRHVFTAV